ncbi:MAG: DUF3108 domain-containing protein [Rhodocyclales bacterium]|nr:DUF3108 domain-containing protein [Rhodocyclales bacterium]
MKLKRPLFVALAISFALHLVVISGPAWNLPTLEELLEPDEGPPLEAHLVAHPGPVAVRPAPVKPRKPKPAAPAVEDGVGRGSTPPAAEPVPPEPVAGPAEPATQEAVAALPTVPMILPNFVRIEYQVSMGEGAFPIGSAVEEVRHDGTYYSMRNTAETTGLVALFRRAKIVNVSAGEIVASGLRPREFWARRDNGKGEAAHLDWDAGQVRLDGGRQYPLEPGTQDMLSMFAQLGLVRIDGAVVSLPVATGKKVERYDFAVLGEERIATPRGERRTLHLRNRQPNGKEATEVWLGLDDARLPIKIRHVDRRGDIFDQIAVRIEFEETKEGTR